MTDDGPSKRTRARSKKLQLEKRKSASLQEKQKQEVIRTEKHNFEKNKKINTTTTTTPIDHPKKNPTFKKVIQPPSSPNPTPSPLQKRKRSPEKETPNKRPKLVDTVTEINSPTEIIPSVVDTVPNLIKTKANNTYSKKTLKKKKEWSFKPLFQLYQETENLHHIKIVEFREKILSHIDEIGLGSSEVDSEEHGYLKLILQKHVEAKDFKNKTFIYFLFTSLSKLKKLTEDFCLYAEQFEGWHILEYIDKVPDSYLFHQIKTLSMSYEEIICRIHISNKMDSHQVLAILKSIHPSFLISKGWDVLLFEWYSSKLQQECVYQWDDINHFIVKLSVHALASGHDYINEHVLHQYAIPICLMIPPNVGDSKPLYITENNFLIYGPKNIDNGESFNPTKVPLSHLCQIYTKVYMGAFQLLRERFPHQLLKEGKDDNGCKKEDIAQIVLDYLFGYSRNRLALETLVYSDQGRICLVTLVKRPQNTITIVG